VPAHFESRTINQELNIEGNQCHTSVPALFLLIPSDGKDGLA
jgi:hypothetical protein